DHHRRRSEPVSVPDRRKSGTVGDRRGVRRLRSDLRRVGRPPARALALIPPRRGLVSRARSFYLLLRTDSPTDPNHRPAHGGETVSMHSYDASRPRRARPSRTAAGTVTFLAATLTAGLAAGCGAGEPVPPADLVLTNGKIVTVDEARPRAEAVAITGDRIVAVGSAREIRRYIGPNTEVIDLEGRLAVPGFIEGHGHFMSLGRARMILDLTTARSWDDIVAMVAEAVKQAQPGEWIQGRGWHQEKWETTPTPNVDGVPLHHSLSAVSPNNPVYLTHASGHASFVNARAMELAGIDRNTRDPAG